MLLIAVATATFGRWQETLDLPLPPANIPAATALATYARGVAFAAMGNDEAARDALATLQANAAVAPECPLQPVIQISALALEGEIAFRAGDLIAAERAFRSAVAIEDGMMYMEPPLWHYPVRHSFGMVLLERNSASEAESVYLEDLKRFPENGWSLIGLENSLRAQGRAADADAVRQRLDVAWAEADVRPSTSRF